MTSASSSKSETQNGSSSVGVEVSLSPQGVISIDLKPKRNLRGLLQLATRSDWEAGLRGTVERLAKPCIVIYVAGSMAGHWLRGYDKFLSQLRR